MYITYGRPVKRQDDPLVRSAEEGFANLGRAVARGNLLVSVFPLLKHYPLWMPGSRFRKEAEELRTHLNEIRDGPFEIAVQMTVRRFNLSFHFHPDLATGKGNSPVVTCFRCFGEKYDGTEK